MSLKTWKAEFCPVPASKVGKKDAVAHSLRKWKGLTERNLKKHGVEYDLDRRAVIGEDGSFPISADTCALCEVYFLFGKGIVAPGVRRCAEEPCSACPLCKSLGEACDAEGMPYYEFVDDGDPNPMIKALEAIK